MREFARVGRWALVARACGQGAECARLLYEQTRANRARAHAHIKHPGHDGHVSLLCGALLARCESSWKREDRLPFADSRKIEDYYDIMEELGAGNAHYVFMCVRVCMCVCVCVCMCVCVCVCACAL